MRVGLLGGLEVLDDDEHEVVVAGAKLRTLLAVLALQAGRVVPTDQLVEALWGDDPPASAHNGLQGLVSKLRRTLGSPDAVAMRGTGYALDLPSSAVDVHRFEQLVAEGRAAAPSDPARGASLLAEAEALWRGDALADFAYDDFATGPIARLSELRLSVIEERLDVELQLGRHQTVVGELEALVAAHPLRERLRGLLMTALYRSGRQAEALRSFQEGRRLLGEELGLDPGPELRRLEAAILAQDPALDVDGSAMAGPAVGPRATSRPSIPAALNALIGRDAERRDLEQLLEDHRLVTLVGPGGVGKTRLALEVARTRAAGLADGGCLVELAPVGDAADVRAAIASALDVPDPSRVAEVIGDRDLLIVLDNCEHVIATAAEVAEDLLRRCPGLHLVATSREGLRVSGETVWPVPPLAADDAVRLFLARAEAGGASLDSSDVGRARITDICARLDGLPLAIELAAARTRAFPVAQIASRLDDRFRLLTGGSRTALPRQQTLRAVVDWSYELLFGDEQRVFERLSVFPGGCDLPTAEAVCADDDLDATDLADIIHALVDKSLVIAVPSRHQPRFTQLQTLAQYGREKLAERGEAERVRTAMAAHYAALCAESAAAFTGERQREWLTEIDAEHDNLRAALQWAVDTDDAETALTIAGGASWPHWLAGTIVEGNQWLEDAFGAAGEVRERTRALGLTGRGLLGFLAGRAEQGDADLRAALDIYRAHDDRYGAGLALSFYAEQAAVVGDPAEARRRRLEVLAFYDGVPEDQFVTAANAYARGKLALLDGDLAAAERHYRAAVDGFAPLDRPIMSSMSMGMVADFDERAGDFEAAIKGLEGAIQTNEELGLRGFTGSLLARLGWVLLQHGDRARAHATYEEALEMARRVRNAPVVFLALAGIAALHRLESRDEAAIAAATEALDVYVEGGPRRFGNRVDPDSDVRIAAAVCCGVLAVIGAERDDPEAAARLLGQADRLHELAGRPAPEVQHDDLARARRLATGALGGPAVEAAVQQGRDGELGVDVPFRS